MDDAFLHQRHEAVGDVPQYLDSFGLGKRSVGGDEILELALAQFLDDVVVIGTLHDLIDGHDVGGFDLLQDLYFLEQSGLEVIVGVDCLG